MATYLNIYAMQANASYLQQVTVACRIAAQNIINEDPATLNHAARLVWAKAVALAAPGNVSLINTMASAVSMNGTLQASAPNGPWADSDIQFVVNSVVTLVAV